MVRLQTASVLDPAIPEEAARRKELIALAAAALAPDKVAGRLTVDVRSCWHSSPRCGMAEAPDGTPLPPADPLSSNG